VIYTGQIDSYFAALGIMSKLEYRPLRFEEEYIEEPDEDYFQEAMVVNYPSSEVPSLALWGTSTLQISPTMSRKGR